MPTKHEINNAFDDAEEEFGDRSTEFLSHIVADRLDVDPSDVIAGLHAVGVECQKKGMDSIPFRYSADKV